MCFDVLNLSCLSLRMLWDPWAQHPGRTVGRSDGRSDGRSHGRMVGRWHVRTVARASDQQHLGAICRAPQARACENSFHPSSPHQTSSLQTSVLTRPPACRPPATESPSKPLVLQASRLEASRLQSVNVGTSRHRVIEFWRPPASQDPMYESSSHRVLEASSQPGSSKVC